MKNSILCDLYTEYLNGSKIDLFKLEYILKDKIQNKIDYNDSIISLSVLLINEPILDYKAAYKFLNRIPNDERSVIIKSYIETWHLGITPTLVNPLNISTISNFQSKSALLFYYSLTLDALNEREKYLQKSITCFQYNFLSIIELFKIYSKDSMSFQNNIKLFHNNVRFIKKLRMTQFYNKTLLYKPFIFSKIFGLDRSDENINLLIYRYIK